MELHRSHDRKATLDAAVVVEINVVCNHLYELRPAGEPVAIVAFPFQDAPEAFHWTVIKAMCHAGHTLLHTCRAQLLVENSACILEALVTVEQWVGLWLSGNGGVKCIKNEFVVVVIANSEGDYPSITKVQNSAEIYLVYFGTHIVFELGHIGQPF